MGHPVALKSPLGLGREPDLGTPNILTSLVVNTSCPYDHVSCINNSHPKSEGLELEYTMF